MPLTPSSLTIRDVTRELMRSLGMTTVFGNPGSTELRFLHEWPADFEYVLALQEASAVAMADGFAQATGNAAFVNLHSAAGLGNALGAVYTAHRNQSPLVITAGQQTRSLLTMEPYLSAESAADFPRPYVKWSIEPASSEDVPAAIARAYYTAMQKPCGPTFVSVPSDDWDSPGKRLPGRIVSRLVRPDPELIATLAEAIRGAQSPALVMGAGIARDGAFDLALRLAERVGGPVWESPVANRASFPQNHALFAGFLPAVPAALSAALAPYDMILVLGAPVFTFHVPGDFAEALAEHRIFQVTDDPGAAAWARLGIGIVGSLRLAIADLLALLPDTKADASVATDAGEHTSAAARRGEAMRRSARARPPALEPTARISAEFLMQTVAGSMPSGAIIVEEAPSHRTAMQRYLPITVAGGFFTMASGGLGYGLPAAVGISLADKSRRVICLIGDGSMMYSIQALWTAAQHALPITFVVLNNRGYGAMRAFAGLLGNTDTPGIELPGLDFVALAQGHGVRASRVAAPRELAAALASALSDPGPRLLDIEVDAAVGALY